jgi:conjugal transfer pilus assembly protein TraF
MADPRRAFIPFAAAFAVVAAFGNSAFADGRAFGFCQDGIQMGWNFYCDPKKQKPNKKPEPTPAATPPAEAPKAEELSEPVEAFPATAAIETARKELDELKNKAIIEPTPENLSAYMGSIGDECGMTL